MSDFPDFNRLDELQKDAIASIEAAQLSQIEHLELSFFVTNTEKSSRFAALLSEWEVSDLGV